MIDGGEGERERGREGERERGRGGERERGMVKELLFLSLFQTITHVDPTRLKIVSVGICYVTQCLYHFYILSLHLSYTSRCQQHCEPGQGLDESILLKL